MLSPLISIQPLSAPRRTCLFGGTTGSTRAIGLPRNVTTSGLPFFCTSFSSRMHLALNSEIKTVFTLYSNLVTRLSQFAREGLDEIRAVRLTSISRASSIAIPRQNSAELFICAQGPIQVVLASTKSGVRL